MQAYIDMALDCWGAFLGYWIAQPAELFCQSEGSRALIISRFVPGGIFNDSEWNRKARDFFHSCEKLRDGHNGDGHERACDRHLDRDAQCRTRVELCSSHTRQFLSGIREHKHFGLQLDFRVFDPWTVNGKLESSALTQDRLTIEGSSGHLK